jgi:hypothetical protein
MGLSPLKSSVLVCDPILATLLLVVASCGGSGSRQNVEHDGSWDTPHLDATPLERTDGSAETGDSESLDDATGDLADALPDTGADLQDSQSSDVVPLDDASAEPEARDAISEDVSRSSVDASRDAPAERPPAAATWTFAPSLSYTAAGVGCMDTGPVGGYQITAIASSPTASNIQLWFPGGSTPLSPGSYMVKPAAGILDVISMPAGMVGLLAERDDAAKKHYRYWGRAGAVTVSASGSTRHVTFTGVTLREETNGAMTTLSADVTCP